MSKTFTSRPAFQTRVRGTSNNTSTFRGREYQLQKLEEMQTGPEKGRTREPNKLGRGRSRVEKIDNQGKHTDPRHGQYGSGPIYDHYGSGPRYGADRSEVDPRCGENNAGRSDAHSETQQGRYAGGYTVFRPNEKRRQEVNQMAQREAENYEQYKEARTRQTFSYVGTVGGEDTSQAEVRKRQASTLWAQKYQRLQRQEKQKQTKKAAEEKEVEKKRAEARKKAEQNAARQQAQEAPAEEVRRKREAFLRQLENKQNN